MLAGSVRTTPAGYVVPEPSNDFVGCPSELIGSTCDDVNECVLTSTLIRYTRGSGNPMSLVQI